MTYMPIAYETTTMIVAIASAGFASDHWLTPAARRLTSSLSIVSLL